MASMTASRSLGLRRVQTRWLGMVRMVAAPSGTPSLEGGDQLRNRLGSQDGRLGSGVADQIGAGDGDVGKLIVVELDLTVSDVSGQAGEP